MADQTMFVPISTSQIRVLLALCTVHERDGRATVRSVADQLGHTVAPVHRHLTILRAAGLADWDDNPGITYVGTLRPTVTITAAGQKEPDHG